jgi:hypothetical protein
VTHPLLVELHSIPPSRVKERCKIGTYLSSADAVDIDAVQQVLDSNVSNEHVATLLHKVMKFHVGSTLVGKHRNEQCVCYRDRGE